MKEHPNKYCDLVMKGGVTSGIVYPNAVLELAKEYRFKAIGGTSAGAIAAAVTAAAALGDRKRRKQGDQAAGVGFEGMRGVADKLSSQGFIYGLFQPAPGARNAFRLIVSLAGHANGCRKLLGVLVGVVSIAPLELVAVLALFCGIGYVLADWTGVCGTAAGIGVRLWRRGDVRCAARRPGRPRQSDGAVLGAVKSYFAGTVAAGIAYLAMIEEGYVWSDHFENLGGGQPGVRKSPDFVFAGLTNGVALMESKGTRASGSTAFDGTLDRGYKKQVEPHLGYVVNGKGATHGYCIGAYLRSTSQAQLRIHHTQTTAGGAGGGGDEDGVAPGDGTALMASDRGGDVPDENASIAAVQLHNYATVLGLVAGADLASRLRRGMLSGVASFTQFNWRGRTWLGPPELQRAARLDPLKLISYQRGDVPDYFFALDRNIATKVFRLFLRDRDMVFSPELNRTLFVEEHDIGRRSPGADADNVDGAIFPDGMAIIAREAQLEGAVSVVLVAADRGTARLLRPPTSAYAEVRELRW